eukprot:SAG31_NODE_2815_length_5045_cov_3.196522_5_plen_164_part_00
MAGLPRKGRGGDEEAGQQERKRWSAGLVPLASVATAAEAEQQGRAAGATEPLPHSPRPAVAAANRLIGNFNDKMARPPLGGAQVRIASGQGEETHYNYHLSLLSLRVNGLRSGLCCEVHCSCMVSALAGAASCCTAICKKKGTQVSGHHSRRPPGSWTWASPA